MLFDWDAPPNEQESPILCKNGRFTRDRWPLNCALRLYRTLRAKHLLGLQQPDGRYLSAIERQAVGQQLGIAALHALHADVRPTQRRGGYLRAHARRFTDQHGDIAGGHQQLFFDLIAAQDLDADGLIL